MAETSRDDSNRCLSRRDFIAGAAALALAGDLPLSYGAVTDGPTTRPSRVVEVHSDHFLRGGAIRPDALRAMLSTGLRKLTGASDEAAAWSAFLSPGDVIGLKFNHSGAAELATTPPIARALVASLTEAGWSPSRIVPIELPDALHDELGTTRPHTGWLPEEVTIGPDRDRLAAFLEQVTAIVNVPFLKTHNLAGMTCCLKNLSHASVKHPAQFHGRGCMQIADIIALSQIRSKLRLHVVNALRVVTEGGPEATPEWITDHGCVLFGSDPVAVDSVALEILNHLRMGAGLGKLQSRSGTLPYLARAGEYGLGRSDLHAIEWIRESV